MPNPIINRRLGKSEIKYDPDALAYFIRAGITNKTERAAINTGIISLKTNGLWNDIVAWYQCSPTGVGASVHNIKSSSFTLGGSTVPTYSQQGWTGNGSNMYFTTGLIPDANGFTLTNHTTGCYVRNNSQTGVDFGARGADSLTAILGRSRSTADQTVYQSATVASQMLISNSNSVGYFNFVTSGAQSRFIRRNNTSLGVDNTTVVVGTVPPTEFYLFGLNLNGTLSTPSAHQIPQFWFYNRALTTTECNTLYTILSTIDANIIIGGR